MISSPIMIDSPTRRLSNSITTSLLIKPPPGCRPQKQADQHILPVFRPFTDFLSFREHLYERHPSVSERQLESGCGNATSGLVNHRGPLHAFPAIQLIRRKKPAHSGGTRTGRQRLLAVRLIATARVRICLLVRPECAPISGNWRARQSQFVLQ